MKKKMAIFSAAIMAVTGAFSLTACDTANSGNEGNGVDKTVMNVSLNPAVEFVLDANDKVVSVNALNEEGNLIISAAAFEGKDAETAVNLFIEVSAETGFLVSGNAAEEDNEIEISFSGDQEAAEKLFNDVKKAADAKFEEFAIKAKIELKEGISQEELQELVAACAPYLEAVEIEAMEYAELVEELYESRKETAEFYSQELKKAYYEAKAHAMDHAKLDVLKEKISGEFALLVETAYNFYTQAVNTLEEQRYNLLVSEDSQYQKALAEFRSAKTAYLNYRNEVANMEQTEVTQAVLDALATYENAVDGAEAVLEQIASSVEATLDSLKSAVDSAYETLLSALESATVKVEEHIDDISQKQKDEHDKFFDDFKDKHGECIDHAKQSWEDMKGGMKKPGGGKGGK